MHLFSKSLLRQLIKCLYKEERNVSKLIWVSAKWFMISFSVNFSQKSIHNEEIAKLGVFSAKIESKGILVEYMLDLLRLRSRIQRKMMQKFGPNSIWQRFSFFYNFSSTIKSYLIYKRLTHTLNVLIGFLSQILLFYITSILHMNSFW